MSFQKTLLVVSLATSSTAHYGDPYDKGCEKDEIAATITGIEGEICIPPCNNDGSCPTDVPAGMTATPKCVINGGGNKYCAPVCTPAQADAQCGTNASCKAATDNGLCTYDDAPPPPSSAHWKGIVSPSFSELSEAINVAFTKDGSVGYCGAGDNTIGPQIIKTVDQGKTWTRQWPSPDGKPAFDLFLASAVKSPTEAIVTGVLFNEYTSDGITFNSSSNDFVDPSQDAKTTPDGKFAIVWGGESKGVPTGGIALSSDGKMWTNTELTANVTIYPPRYGAYPTATTWYMSAGNFPTSGAASGLAPEDAKLNLHHLNYKVALNKDTFSYHFKHGLADNTEEKLTFDLAASAAAKQQEKASSQPAPGRKLLSPPAPVSCLVDPANCFSVGLFKTTDAGKTWTMTYSDLTNNIYPNGIDCDSDLHCIAVVEGDSCQILVTVDGGKNWATTHTDTDPACSLTYVATLSATEAWVGGGHLTYADFEGRFYHTLDGGKTWTLEEVKGLYIFDLDMPSPTVGYAVGITESGQGAGLLQYQPNPSK